MKTGLELIQAERQEQIEKHKWTLEHDQEVNKNKELVQAAKFCLSLTDFHLRGKGGYYWPNNWNISYMNKIMNKSEVGKLVVAGALLMAENERRGDKFWDGYIVSIAEEIDLLQQHPGGKA